MERREFPLIDRHSPYQRLTTLCPTAATDHYNLSRRLRNMNKYKLQRGTTVGAVSIALPSGPAKNNNNNITEHSQWMALQIGEVPVVGFIA